MCIRDSYKAIQQIAQVLPLRENQFFPSKDQIDLALEHSCARLANEYNQLLSDFVPTGSKRFDMVVLGVGEDGHTASIFPNHHPPEDTRAVSHIQQSPKPPADRVSLTMPAINAARSVLVVASGTGKKSVLHKTLCTKDPLVPIAQVAPSSGEVTFLMDQPAAPEECLRGQHFVWFGSRGALAKKYSWRMLLQLHRKGSMKNALVHAVGSDAVAKGTSFVSQLATEKDACPAKEEEAGRAHAMRLDSNGDGVVDAVEFEAEAEEFPQAYDLNADGVLDLDEMARRSCGVAIGRFLGRMSYSQLTRTKDPDEIRSQYHKLGATMDGMVAELHGHDSFWKSPRHLFYLSVPPSAYVATIKMVTEVVLGPRPWADGTTFLIEKPFGFDLADVKDRQTKYQEAGLEEEDIWRLDHYLGKQGVRNLLEFRSLNPGWSSQWSGEFVERIEVVVQEEEDVEDRVDYYGETGAVRDMMVNHLMAVLASAGMSLANDPVDAGIKRARFVGELEPVRREDLVVAQYDGYQDQLAAHHELNPTARKCQHAAMAPTAALATLRSKDPHWAGTEFVVAHGKATDSRQAYTKVLFKDKSEISFHIQGGPVEEYVAIKIPNTSPRPVSYTHLRAHETPEHLVCRLLLEKKKTNKYNQM
eukprot:TRINITY_DN12718_c0_g1_i4.p1 TRINITY_DN12718_c0_g1~~TRINITY_DN12718_c0_g1_i4.p1  ORF type:complete len:643 (-),score=161.96 TRINITY_DN12718_c0_g1_i4:30-1958(-)